MKQIWLNLPVKNANDSKTFFSAIGFSFIEEHTTPNSACMLVGEKQFVIMLFEEPQFVAFSQVPLPDTKSSSELLISIDASSRKEVDEFALLVTKAGGNLFAPPAEIEGWMYGCAFADLDGHRWNMLYMDLDKIAK
ncbi:VOC family protein [Flavobacterium agrisoli]|uniref:Extradiol dioxygenase n=1 Tax=Flavobacterium agrisoli TaxID=2793066 RepID=A0A934PN81_9FLAO|nr:extradiol dioxygenase [Flavobacterium agrisoli]MBK0370300.1 extradiol dioxygenase [Flavobacterium agrisoli]